MERYIGLDAHASSCTCHHRFDLVQKHRLRSGHSPRLPGECGARAPQARDQDLEHLETRGLERRIWQTAAPLPDGRIAVDDMHASANGGQSTVSILGPTGRLDRELLEVPDPVVRTLLAPASEGGFWALRGNGNRLERYGPDGELVDAVVIEGGSVAPWAEGRMDGEGQEVPRRPRYTGFSELGDGTFLLVAWVSPEEWTPGSDAEGGAMLAPATMNVSDAYDTVLELVDATSGQVLARARVPDALSVVQGAPTLFHSRHPDGELGHVITRIWRAELGSR